MASLIAFGLALHALASPAQAIGAIGETKRWHTLTAEAASRFALPEQWIRGVLYAESAGRAIQHGRYIRSAKGAIGLMQLMPTTWDDMRVRLQLGQNPDDPHDNIIAGAGYLRILYDQFGYPGLFAAYNMGPRRYTDYLAGKIGLPRETISYLGKNLRAATAAIPRQSAVSRNPIFLAHDGLGDEAALLPTSLFVIVKGGS